jgi:beta-galactosidase
MKPIAFIITLFVSGICLNAQYAKGRIDFNQDWKFYLGEEIQASKESFNDKNWRVLNLPHDWSIELPFDENSPTGTGGGALRGGMGWYRKTFTTPEHATGKKVFIDFDGVYMNSEVFINGVSLGVRPNGYISFRYDLTAHLKPEGGTNVIAVKVDNSRQPNSRWYSGSGIYRNVWLVVSNPVHVAHWGTYATTPQVNAKAATLQVKTSVLNELSSSQSITVVQTLINKAGKEITKANANITLNAKSTATIDASMQVANPALWSIENPNLYQLVTKVLVDNITVDEYVTPVGFRSLHFDVDNGFFLNNEYLKIRGVCMHHDLGALGTAINRRALERQLEILKAMGCNAIRTSHNPPAPELLDLCDEMGFLVMDEAFDMWKRPKSKYDYSNYWDEWHAKDLTDLVMRDRNHPSVFMWSLGNEIPEQWDKYGDYDATDTTGREILRRLYSILKKLDTTRPSVTGNNEPKTFNNLLLSGANDVIGYNYHHADWDKDSVHKNWGRKPFIVTESVSALQSRGHYDMPSEVMRRWPVRWDSTFTTGNDDFTCSAYENCSTPWGTTHEETLKIFEKQKHNAGMFVWTGFDYMGEPTPYGWPARSSYFGIVDMAGFPKDAWYLYQSVWTEKPMLHLFPHWTWQPGKAIDIWAYYSGADEVELFVNGKSKGVKRKTGDELHVMWRTTFQPGVIKAVSRKNGKVVLTQERKTAGEPAKLVLKADRGTIAADGKDLSFVTVQVVDKNGILVPDAHNIVKFEVTGDGSLAGVDNGWQTDLSSLKGSEKRAFNGLCLAILQSNGKAGNIQLKATSAGLEGAAVQVAVK